MRFFIIYFLLLSASATYAQPLAHKSSELNRSSISARPIHSGDGSVVIFSSQARRHYRGPVLIFVNRTKTLFQSGLNLKLGSDKCPLEIRIGDKSNGDRSVLTARVRDVNGGIRERIDLPDPEAADLNQFRRAVAVAFLRVWMLENGGTDKTMRDLPSWLINGMMRFLQGKYRQADLDRTYLLWSHGCLPPAERLYSFNSFAAKEEPAVASVLTGWFLEKRGHAFKLMLKKTALGVEWSPQTAAAILVDGFQGDFDRIFDLRMFALGRRVIQPGVTTPGIMSRFRSELLLFPSDYGMMFNKTNFVYTFRDAVRFSDRHAIKQAASEKALKIRAVTAGRDGALLALSEKYGRFLRALAGGENESDLLSMLRQAEAMRLDLEKSLEDGKILKRKDF
ncbi:MAG: hypothetical protein R6V06_05740 [Kiritimatiellia bacterium]